MAGPSHMYMEPPGDPSMVMQVPGAGLLPQHPHLHHPHPPPQQQQPGPPPQPQMPHYMQMPLETEQPQEFSLAMPRQTLPQELAQQQQLMPPMLLHSAEEQRAGELGEHEELLWMQQMPPEDLPPHTTS